MYLYFYDKLTQEPRHARRLATIEARLGELGIAGRIERLSIFKNARELIQDAVKQGAHTVIAVGDDTTFFSVLSVVAPLNATLGFIPLVHTPMSDLFGIPVGEDACAVLSQRIKISTTLGRVNQQYFLRDVEFRSPVGVTIDCDENFTVRPNSEIAFFGVENQNFLSALADPNNTKHDGLRLVATKTTPKKRRWGGKVVREPATSIPFSKARCTSASTNTCILDGSTPVSLPCTITNAAEPQDIIVGRDRQIAAE